MRGGKRLAVNSKQSTVDSKRLTENGRRLTVNGKRLTVLVIFSILLISFVTVAIATGFFGTNTTKVSSLEKGLVAHYPLDGVYQTKDLTPYGNHGTNHGATLTTGVKDEPNGAYSFDGNDYINLGRPEEHNFIPRVDEFSISVWYKSTNTGVFYSFGGSTGIRQIQIDIASTLEVYVGQIESARNIISSSLTPNYKDGKWHQVAIVIPASSTGGKFYYDGNLITSSLNIGSGTAGNNAYIGARTDGTGYPLTGAVSDLRIYNRLLSDEEIKLLYDSYKPKASASDLNKGLVGHWMLDAENEGSVNNLIVNGNFEDSLTGWSLWSSGETGTMTIDTSTYYSGTQSAKLTGVTCYISRVTPAFTVGKTYKFKAMIRTASGTNIRFVAGGADIITNIPTTAGKWGEIVGYWKATNAYIGAGIQGYGSDTFWVDDFSVTEVIVKDLTPYGNHGTAQGGVTIGGAEDRKGKSGGATSFDGSNYITILDNDKLPKGAGERSVSVWFKSSNSVSDRLNILGYGATSVGNMFDLMIDHGVLWGHFYGGGYTTSGIPVTFNEWNLVVITYNGTTTKLYYNDELVDDQNFNLNTLNGDLYIGRGKYESAGVGRIKGQLSDVRIYNRALSEDEIKLLYDSYKPKEVSVGNLNKGLVLDMPLTTKWMKSNTIVSDRTPYGNDGTISGANITNEGAVFDGVNDYIDLGNTKILIDKDKPFTISTWYNWSGIFTDDSRYQRFVELRVNGYANGFSIVIGNDTNFNGLYYGGSGIIYPQMVGFKPTINVWNYLTLTYNGNGMTSPSNYKLYLNNVLTPVTTGPQAYSASTQQNFIGRRGTADSHFNGSISNLKIYNRVLSDEEVKFLYDKGR